MCGEKASAPGAATPFVGSPPHVRGKDYKTQLEAKERGITPACAGKSRSVSMYDLIGAGSPPHVRGKVLLYLKRLSQLGITPACAGKSRQEKFSRLPDEDHPRMCGEKHG